MIETGAIQKLRCGFLFAFNMCSVPHGSVLGPLLFVLYMADLADIAARYNLTSHASADDNQLYIHCKPENVL